MSTRSWDIIGHEQMTDDQLLFAALQTIWNNIALRLAL